LLLPDKFKPLGITIPGTPSLDLRLAKVNKDPNRL
jgi:hypothetical protein